MKSLILAAVAALSIGTANAQQVACRTVMGWTQCSNGQSFQQNGAYIYNQQPAYPQQRRCVTVGMQTICY
jgi:hypothetical protein